VKFSWILALGLCLHVSAEDITPRIGNIEIYGVYKVSPEKIKSSLGLKPGDPLPARLTAEEKIDRLSGVVDSRVQAFCCDGQKTILYIGIEEKNAPHIEYHPVPTGTVVLPQEIVDKYQALLNATADSLRARNADEDLTNGYSLMADPQCREIQQTLIPLVTGNLANVDQVIRESQDADQRAAAAYVIQYAPRTPRAAKTVVDSLQYAIQDPDDTVRDNAMMALKAVMVGVRLHPEQHIHIEPTWFVQLMNSVVWSDRHNASLALLTLTDKGDQETLDLLRQRALPSVVEMAQWQDLNHALPGFLLAGRLAGMDEKEIMDAWSSGNRDEVLKRALNPNGKRSILHRQSKKQD
jgi:hypothetical protein